MHFSSFLASYSLSNQSTYSDWLGYGCDSNHWLGTLNVSTLHNPLHAFTIRKSNDKEIVFKKGTNIINRPPVKISSSLNSPPKLGQHLVIILDIRFKTQVTLLSKRKYYIQVSQEECARFREGVPYVKVYRYNAKHLYPKLNGYGDNVQWSLKLWQLLHTYWLPNTY